MGKRAAGFVLFRRIYDEIQYLLLRASYGDFHWSSPKGHVDAGEDDFTTALRETKEEAGYGFYCIYHNGNNLFLILDMRKRI